MASTSKFFAVAQFLSILIYVSARTRNRSVTRSPIPAIYPQQHLQFLHHAYRWNFQSQKSMVYGYSSKIQFSTLQGFRLRRYINEALFPTVIPDVIICDYKDRRPNMWWGNRPSNYNISVTVEYGNNLSDDDFEVQGRYLSFKKPRKTKAVVLCVVTEKNRYKRRNSIYWNYLIYSGVTNDDKASVRVALNNAERMWTSLSFKVVNTTFAKTDNVTICCQLIMDTNKDKMDHYNVQLYRIKKNGKGNQREAVAKSFENMDFSWTEDGKLLQNVSYQYIPTKFDTAEDTFECVAWDYLQLLHVSKNLTVRYLTGVEWAHIVNVSGNAFSDYDAITKDDTIRCVANTEEPKVKYTWTATSDNALKNFTGPTLSLRKIFLFHKICCTASNKIGKILHSKKTCLNFRDDSTMKSASAYDRKPLQQMSLTCPLLSKMGFIQARYSQLKCNALDLNGTKVKVNNNHTCDTSSCISFQTKQFIEKSCNLQGSSCIVNVAPIMTEFLKNALRKEDLLSTKCFEFNAGLIKVEVDYYCTTPKAVTFNVNGRGRRGNIQFYTVPKNGCYEIVAKGAAGGNHSTEYGPSGGGTWYGGKGAVVTGQFMLTSGQNLSIVVGQSGGNSTEISPRHRPSIEDNAGTGGGGGTFVYDIRKTLYVAAGGGGGASYALNGVPGQKDINGTDSTGPVRSHIGKGGRNGSAGNTKLDSASYHGGVGSGWLTSESARRGIEHGGPGGGIDQKWSGGKAGGMNPGAVGGFGGGGGGSEDNGASGGGGGYSGGGAGSHERQAGGGGGSYCRLRVAANCSTSTGANNDNWDGQVIIYSLGSVCRATL